MKNNIYHRSIYIKHFIVVLLIIIGLNQLPAQSIPHTVVGNAGGYYENLLFGNLHWTVGEVAVSLHQNGPSIGEGFHRAYFELIVSTDDVTLDWDVKVFPNPTTDFLQIKLAGSEVANAQLFASNGQLLVNKDGLLSEAIFDFTSFPAGTYWLKLQGENGQQRSFQVIKVRQ